jgi:hypothetical protein
VDEPNISHIVKHIILLIIVNTLWVASATAQSMSRHDVFGRYQQVNWQELDGLRRMRCSRSRRRVFDRDISTRPARPHGVAIFQAQDD